MRQAFTVALTAAFVFSLILVTGCGKDEKAKIPDKMMELPKQGPVASGGGPAPTPKPGAKKGGGVGVD